MGDLLGVGDEVICIDDGRPQGWSSEIFPEWVLKDSKYIIREVFDNDDIVVGILLNQLRNPLVYQKLIGRDQEPAFATWRFSKLRSAYAIAEKKESEEVKEVEKVDEDSHSEYLNLIEKKKY